VAGVTPDRSDFLQSLVARAAAFALHDYGICEKKIEGFRLKSNAKILNDILIVFFYKVTKY
jgi:hypothetical protein